MATSEATTTKTKNIRKKRELIFKQNNHSLNCEPVCQPVRSHASAYILQLLIDSNMLHLKLLVNEHVIERVLLLT